MYICYNLGVLFDKQLRPFEQDNENVISKLFQRVRSSFSTSSTTSSTSSISIQAPSNATNSSETLIENGSLNSPPQTPDFKPLNPKEPILLPDKENKGFVHGIKPAPPVVSLEPAFGNTPTVIIEPDTSGQEHTNINGNGNNNIIIGNGISSQQNQVYDPGHSFQLHAFKSKDVSDTRSIRSVQTTSSVGNSYSISKVIRRLRGEGVNKDYWMADDTCRECYDCKSTFTLVRRKHHCRICGQIFCSRCASNSISGRNFNHEGLMRVCNFCLKLMKEYGEDFSVDNEQGMTEKSEFNNPVSQRSVLPDSHGTNLATPEIQYTLSGQNSYAPPPRAPSPDTLSININDGISIKKMFSVASSSLFMTRSRSNTITEDVCAALSSSPAPFRRGITEEDKVLPAVNPEAILDPDIAAYMSNEEDDGHYDLLTSSSNVLTFLSANAHANGESATPTPAVSEYAGSDDEIWEYNVKTSHVLKAFQKGQRTEDIRNHFQIRDKSSSSRRRSFTNGRPSRLSRRGGGFLRQINTNIMQPMDISMISSPIERPSSPLNSRHVRSSSAIKPVINPASLDHMRRLLRQFLLESKINLSDGWEDVIMKLMMKVSDNLNPNVRNGDEIDIRHYVKIKKIPGGIPQDSEYVHGVVCTKNLAHKKMPRTLHNPRVLILTFALEYHRVENQLMSLQPVMAQEEEHLKNLVARIVALRPHLVLVEKTVARLALQFLLEKNVTVALNVKPSVIEAVARCTRADIIPSIDKLALEPRLGKCGTFSVKTFVHQLIPSRRRTYLVFENCPRELGCTIALRGGDICTLEKIKRITDLMVFVVYNLKLETALLTNQFAKTPSVIPEGKVIDCEKDHEIMTGNTQTTDNIMRPYEDTILSVSPFIKFPAPYLLIRMKEAERNLTELSQKRTGWPSGIFKDGEKPLSSSSTVGGLSGILRTPEQVCAEGELAEAFNEHMAQMRAWENYVYNKLVSPYAHQNITVLSSKFCTVTGTPCIGPETLVMEYYRESDRTLGQYLEEMCSRSTYLCRTCDRPLIMHYHSFCHGNARITIVIEEYPCPVPNMENKIFMWSYCKKCEKATQVNQMSEDTWKYSFGKYLELSFYQTESKSIMENCPHSIFQDHIWYFGLNNLAVKFEYEPIELLEVHVPPMQLYTKPEIHIKLKNQDLDTIRHKITNYWDSVSDRIKSFNYDIVQSDKVEGCKQELLEMSRRVVTEKKYMLQKLQQTYVNSTPEDTLELNNVMYVLQEKVLVWDKDFNDIARQYFPRLTARQLKRLFVDKHDVITLGRGYSGSLLNDLPLINMDLDDGSNTVRIEDEVFGPTIFPKLSSSPTADAILNELKDIEFYHDGEIESLEKDIENVNSQMSLFPFVDPKVSRRLSMKWMKESKAGQRPTRTTSEAIFTTIIDKQDSNSDLTAEPAEIPRLLPSTIKHKSDHLPSSYGFPSFENVAETETLNNYRSLTQPSSLQCNPSTTSRINLMPSVLEKEKDKSEVPPTRRTQLRRNQNSPADKSNISRIARKNFISPSQKTAPTECINSVIRNRKFSALHKSKRRPAIFSTKPTIEVFRNVSAATAEESDEFEEGEEGDYNKENEEMRFFLNSTDEFDESLGNEEFFPMSGREPSNESYIYHSASAFLGPDFNEPTPAADNFLNSGRILIDSNDQTVGVMPLVRTIANFWTDKKNYKPLDYPLSPTEHVFPDSSIIVREDEPSSIIAFALSSQEYLEKLKTMQQSNHNSEVAFMPEGGTVKSSNWTILDAEESGDVEDGLISHMKYQFSGGSTQFFCKIFCAEQFDNLRRKCGCESTYIQSLARCVKWDSSGGKSGSAFLKTRDDRLVMKQMSRNEVEAFSKFAPKYFEYMSDALVHLPTVLAKIFGFYRIGFRNDHSGKNMKIDVIVMENLFYERKVSKIFDLKGSMRNRHVQSTGRQNEVLLDENLLELIMNEKPLYLREHSKKLLHESLFNDTLFLARHNVMDYSLLVGFDEEKHELVVGIVDIIRTFTWDKKLESWVKESGFLGGGGKEPTIVSPRQYKNRFREAMDRYFLMVPDRWISYQSLKKAGVIL
ncbi:13415_t:CDS:10 [Funneliformis mosseae]|uniref:1-phosphatidylinositol-3-phosphate 5-kinase n=1 Tax=Funneliformis mosseae TaxID=27381 RepID=A0A9N8ZHC5_FUNMO|nr:13415_t:CDS:10 [Funneliformis mosseae]